MVVRNGGVDVLRAVATVAVVELHCLPPYFAAAKGTLREEVVRCVLDAATPSFFFLAGYLPGRLGKRLRRAVVPLVVASAAKWGVDVAVGLARRKFWNELLEDLAMTHLGPKKFPENCVVHDELRGLESFFRYDAALPSVERFAWEALTGTAFGHYYFIPALCELHVLVRIFPSDAAISKLAVLLSVWHFFRRVLVRLNIPDVLLWRTPVLWAAHYVNGIAVSRGLPRRYGGCLPGIVAASALIFALVFTAALVSSSDAPHLSSLLFFCKDLYVLALPPAVVLSWPQRKHPAPRIAAELSRLSYAIYLYHGFFLNNNNARSFFPMVFGAALALAYAIQLCCKPQIAALCFGIIAPTPRQQQQQQQQQQQPAAHAAAAAAAV
ncbi:hypothetical protein CTAYLR_002624 [Chrysophaeum taylorii]|uniref:Acyltransferase 3 domain-containing protein n=1 Tax=Chrysophaeum taylorii TaxID=2483200 RepID=A0AAD7UF83_9STRA|nr:hypothetical protein CTAYLR_002624 [Chrysophaeum taylorii]